MGSNIFKERLAEVSSEAEEIIASRMAIRKQIKYILANHSTIKTQEALAKAMDKEPSEISKWLSGLHNLTHETIVKMELVLGQKIIMTDLEARAQYQETVIMHLVDREGYLSSIDAVQKININSGGAQEY
ncbi:MAG TPA: helix-turn-helix transcriptional regulator [Ferruginibacter sp.]|nr:helix-turn-helix transcriptional regulator [Ferruginibacter sp.]